MTKITKIQDNPAQTQELRQLNARRAIERIYLYQFHEATPFDLHYDVPFKLAPLNPILSLREKIIVLIQAYCRSH